MQATIEPVITKSDLKEVVLFPFRLYRHDPFWVPPLISERMEHYDPHHNPFFQHATMQMFRAVRDGQTVGTIAAIDDALHREVWNDSVGFFGVFEVIEEYEVAAQLLSAARRWLAERGIDVMRGPANLNINDEFGLLVEGFDGMPVIMMPYNPRYYQTFLERYGMVKAKDLLAFKLDIASYGPNLENLPERVSRVARIAQERYHIEIRHVDLKQLDREVELLKPVYRQAWRKNWGAVPMTDAEFSYMAKSLKQIIDPELTYLAFYEGQPIGCFLVVPDYCQVAYHLNGRLFPFGWVKYLWYKRRITGVRVVLMGVLEEHRLKGVEALFYQEGCRVAIRKGYQWAEMSWILEDNYKVIRGIEMMGGKAYRRYRVYDMPTS
ncbi:MAG: N-acetyltransferase [Chloroflexi bacterium]|nr:N-acetyltransferase [Chloroflexota bacterium]